MKPFWLALAVVLSLAATRSWSAQIVLDFDDVAVGTRMITMASYQADGFSLTSDIDPVMLSDAFAAWGTSNDNFTGSVALFNQYAGTDTTLAAVAPGQPFDLSSIDLAPAFRDGGVGATVQLQAVRANGIHLTGSCSFGSALTYTTCMLPTFTNVISVTWEQGDIPHQFDNLILTTPVPEPGQAAMLLAGLMLLLGRRPRNE